jgi:hypothetical protein
MFSNIGPENRKVRLIFGSIMLIISFLLYFEHVPALIVIAFLSASILLLLQATLSFCVFHGFMNTRDLR